MNYHEIHPHLLTSNVGVMPTDTIYGLVGQALLPDVVERIYKLKQRDESKPLVVLIGSPDQLAPLGIEVNDTEMSALHEVWPGPTSVVLKCSQADLRFLHRGTWTLAVRLPELESLRNLLLITGPLVATSANIEGRTPATTVEEARAHFGDQVDFYLDGGEVRSEPSRIIKIANGSIAYLR